MVKVCDMTEEEHARVLEYKRQWREKKKDKINQMSKQVKKSGLCLTF